MWTPVGGTFGLGGTRFDPPVCFAYKPYLTMTDGVRAARRTSHPLLCANPRPYYQVIIACLVSQTHTQGMVKRAYQRGQSLGTPKNTKYLPCFKPLGRQRQGIKLRY